MNVFASLVDAFECADSHQCNQHQNGKRCAFCELHFQFIAKNPVQLECGHTICEKCFHQKESDNFHNINCKHHGDTKTMGHIKFPCFLIVQNMPEFMQLLKKNSENSLELLIGIY